MKPNTIKKCPIAKAYAQAFDMNFDCLDCWQNECIFPQVKKEFEKIREEREKEE